MGTDVAWETVGDTARCLLAPVWVAASRGDIDVSTLLRAVEASLLLRAGDRALLKAVTDCVVLRRDELDVATCATLHEFLALLGCPADTDVMLALADCDTVIPT